TSCYTLSLHDALPICVVAESTLLEALREQVWDLCVAREESDELGYQEALAHIRRLDKDIPFLLLSNQYDADLMTEVMLLGAADRSEEHTSELQSRENL